MGSALEICNQVDKANDVLQDGSEEVNDEQYYLHEQFAQADPHFLAELERLKKDPEFEEFLEGKQFRKHKEREEYYLGAWEGRHKKGKGVSYRPGEYLYYGQFDSVPNGSGQLTLYQQNLLLTGRMLKGRPVGACTIKELSGVFSFEGILSDQSLPQSGQFEVLHHEHPERSYLLQLDNYPEQPAKIHYKDSTEYEGEVSFETLLPEGKGTAHYANRTSYSGQWLKGEYHGHGKYSWSDGSSYEGNYIHGIKSGQGTYTYVSGKAYQGEWAHGKQEGEGRLFSSSGEVLKQGRWKGGVYVKQEQHDV